MNYEPEMGQMIFGQPHKEFSASRMLDAALAEIRNQLDRAYWNVNQEQIVDPFGNTGGSYKNDTFEVCAYSWDEEKEQLYNFKWKDIQISWYKHSRRGVSVNMKLSNDRIEEMLEDCLKSLFEYERHVFDMEDDESEA